MNRATLSAAVIFFAVLAANPGYRLELDAVDAASTMSWGRVKALYR